MLNPVAITTIAQVHQLLLRLINEEGRGRITAPGLASYSVLIQFLPELFNQCGPLLGPFGGLRYGVKKLDGIVEQIARYRLFRISAASGAEIVAKQNEKAIELAKARYNAASTQLAEKQNELKTGPIYTTLAHSTRKR